MHYRNLILRVDRHQDAYRVRVIESPDGANQVHKFSAPQFPTSPTTAEAEESAPPQRDVRRPGKKAQWPLSQAGRLLFEAIFSGSVGRAYRVSMGLARSHGEGLRLQLQLNEVPETATWPWEALFDPESGQFLSVMSHVSVVRALDMPGFAPPTAMLPPLRVLVVTANPRGQLQLDVEKEWRLIEKAFEALSRQSQVRLERLEHATVDRLVERLTDQSYHVLHFIGHGEFDNIDGGHLILEDASGRAHGLSTERLGAILSSQTQLRLVFLNACEGALHSPTDPFTGVAQSLLRQGIPAILAMSSAIRDDLASRFAGGFYQALARRSSIETAVAQARQMLFSRIEYDSWATPVFYTRDTDLLDLSEAVPRARRPWLWTGSSAALLATAAGLYWGMAPAQQPLPLPPFEEQAARCPSPANVDLQLLYVPAGSFTLGPGDGNHVNIAKPFCLASRETTQAQWLEIMGGRAEDPSTYESPERPVHGLNAEDIMALLDRLNTLVDDEPFRLPKEEEWEYAARQGGDFDLDLENDPEWLEKHGNCRSASGADGFDGVAPVAQFNADAWGFYDLRGNVWEWTEEYLDDFTGPFRLVLRGGSFVSTPDNCRSTTSAFRNPNRRSQEHGIRLARDPLPAEEDE